MFIIEPSAEVIQILSEYLEEETAHDIFHTCCSNGGVSSSDFRFEDLPEFLYNLVNTQEMYGDLGKADRWAIFDRLAELSNQRNDKAVRITFARV